MRRSARQHSKPSRLDSIINSVAPGWGVKRAKARRILELASYTGASKTRKQTKEWTTSSGDANSDILPELEDLRDRSRDLVRNAPLAGGAINTKVTSIVGTGLKLQSRIDRKMLSMGDDAADEWENTTESEWRVFAESQECDIERTLNFYGIQELAFRSTLENGDCFCLTPSIERTGVPYNLKLQLIEADRVSNKDDAEDSTTLAGGVRRDNVGAVTGYDILKGHPGNDYSKNDEWTTVPAFGKLTGRRSVLHLFQKIRIGQSRGVPDLAPVIELLKQLSRFTDAHIAKSVIESMFTVFITSEEAEGLNNLETGTTASDTDFKMASGAMLDLAPGEDVKFANPNSPSPNFDSFVLAIMRQIGVRLELPFEILVKHFTASYSASQAALLEAWRFYNSRRKWLSDNLCAPVYEIWLTEAVAQGRINAPGFLSGDPLIRAAYLGADWIGDPRGHLDPLKENRADGYAEDRGWKTGAQNTAARGNDWDRNFQQRVKEVNMRREAGLEPELEPAEDMPLQE